MKGGEVAGDLEGFLRGISSPPKHGRYVSEPAQTDERGVDSLPPKPADPIPYLLGAEWRDWRWRSRCFREEKVTVCTGNGLRTIHRVPC